MGRLVVVGDALLDRDVDGLVERLCPEAPVPVLDELSRRARPGGAALAAALAAADGTEVVLITALARDAAGRALRGLIEDAGVEIVDLGRDGETAEKVRLRVEGRLLIRLDRGERAPARIGAPGEEAASALASARGVLVSDYGRGVAAHPALGALLTAAARRVPLVWDPHPRGSDPVPGARLVTPNRSEAAGLVPEVDGGDLRALAERGEALLWRWSAHAVALTLGAEGAVLVSAEASPLVVPAPPAAGGDPCGAGDRFASAAAALLADGALTLDAVTEAVRSASAFVGAGGAGALGTRSATAPRRPIEPSAEDAFALAERVRAAGGTVVATGGCFDLLHAGHVATLQAARELGDCLIVCLNSDESVRRLKGHDRPLVPETDRAAVLRALACVDAVAVFDEDTPETVLERLRPDLFAKGGDYALGELPEASLVARWGGQAVILPYVEGRSTTRLLEEVALRGR